MKKILFLVLILFFINSYAQVIRRAPQPVPAKTETVVPDPYTTSHGYGIRKPFEFKKQSLISLAITDFIFTNLTLKYEYFTKSGKVGFQIPFSFNLGSLPDTMPYPARSGYSQPNSSTRFLSAKNRIFQTGLNINYYLIGQRVVSPYVGASLGIGWFNYWQYAYTYISNPYGGGYYTYTGTGDKQIASNYQCLIHAGLLLNPSETITFNFKAGLGFRRYANTNTTEYTVPTGTGEISIGFKF